MKCPVCQSKSTVKNTIYKKDFTIRYRTCLNPSCRYKFKTIETVTKGWNYKSIVKKIKDLVMDVEF